MVPDSEQPLPAERKKRIPRPRAGAVTVHEVAKEAGVSVATVSRVLNGKATVAAELRQTVLLAAQKLSYTPHAAARALASQRFTTLGAVVPTLEDPNFSLGIAALQRRLHHSGYTLLLASSDYDPEEELRQVQALVAHGIAGLLLVGARRSPGTYAMLRAKAIPHVNTWVLDDSAPCVGFDNRAVGSTVADYLLELGHTAFGVIAQSTGHSDRAAARLEGIRHTLARAGVAPAQERLIERSHKIIDGQLAMRTLMQGPQRPTAVICGTDTLAFGALVEAAALGISVPHEVSVTGINDAEFAAHLNPTLTTVQLPAEEVGLHAANYLLDRIGGHQVVDRMPLQFRLVVRGSTARARIT